jgi:hypothetical protein
MNSISDMANHAQDRALDELRLMAELTGYSFDENQGLIDLGFGVHVGWKWRSSKPQEVLYVAYGNHGKLKGHAYHSISEAFAEAFELLDLFGSSVLVKETRRYRSESKSFRKPTFYRTKGADPSFGKKQTSGEIRAKERAIAAELEKLNIDDLDLADLDDEDFFVDDPRDATRGKAGSRSPDYGWDYFGDGRVHGDHPRLKMSDQEWVDKIRRK